MIFNYISLAYAVLILMKSLAVVVARVFYSKFTFKAADETDDTNNVAGNLKSHGDRYTILKSVKTPTYAAFHATGTNVIDRKRIPQWNSLALARILSRNYILSLIDMKDKQQGGTCNLKVDPPANLVEWSLKPGEEVFLFMRDVVSFSETCVLNRRTSLNLASLVFGRIFYHTISGPGKLILKTNSSPILGNSQQAKQTLHSGGLLAWNRNTEFNIISSLTQWDVFFSGYSIRKTNRPEELIVYDTSQSRLGKRGSGIWRMTRTFLLPI